MKKIGFLITQKEKKPVARLENKDIFYLFERIIKQEYGNRGVKSLKPGYFSKGKIFVKSDSSIFSSELLLNKNEIIRKLNQEIGNEEIVDIRVN